MLVLWLLLWYFTARRASVIAKWVVVVLFGLSVIGLLGTLISYQVAGALSTFLSLGTFALTGGSVWLLFRPDAQRWFAGEDAQADSTPFE